MKSVRLLQIGDVHYGNSLTVKSDGSVVYSYHEEGLPENTDEDISGSALGRLLRQFSAQGPKELSLEGGSLRCDSPKEAPNVRTYVGMNEVNEKNDNPQRNVRKEQSQTTRFRQKTEQTLLTSGITLDQVRYLASLSGCRAAVENCNGNALHNEIQSTATETILAMVMGDSYARSIG